MARKRVTRKTKRAAPRAKRAPVNKFAKKSLAELLIIQREVEAAIDDARKRERADVLSRMENLAQESGFSLSELVGRGRGKGKVSVAKYANPDDPIQTWTGRGRKPNWLVTKLKKGARMDDFAI